MYREKWVFFNVMGDLYISRGYLSCTFKPHQSKQRMSLQINYMFCLCFSL